MKGKKLDIAIDFDGTCVAYAYPNVGADIGSIPILRALVENGHNLILYTMRTGKELVDAASWFERNDLPLYGIHYNPTQKNWTSSTKCYAHLYIDDAALGCPLIQTETKPYVDWKKVEEILKEKSLI